MIEFKKINMKYELFLKNRITKLQIHLWLVYVYGFMLYRLKLFDKTLVKIKETK